MKAPVGFGFVTSSRPPSDPIGLAFEWVARITAVALAMVLPGIGGQWAADRFGLPVLTLVGWAIGLIGGFAFLMIMTGVWKLNDGNGSDPM